MSTATTTPSTTEVTYPSVQLFIAGQWRDGGDRKTLAVHDPATGKADWHRGGGHQGRPRRGLRGGAARIRGVAQGAGIRARQDDARGGAPAARARRRHRALDGAGAGQAAGRGQGRDHHGLRHHRVVRRRGRRVLRARIPAPRQAGVLQQVFKEPVGPVAAFTPWNFPINQVVRKLVGGARPPAARSSSRRRRRRQRRRAELIRAFADAGVPAGVREPGLRQPGRDLAAT